MCEVLPIRMAFQGRKVTGINKTEILEHLLRWPPEGAADAEMAESTLLLGGADGQ